ncbi:flagellin [Sphingobium subterraneum]|uniref:Flagellar hook-associated protein 3 FlgL n=1 Tax=Sphingobium subterraneum TaxID=627688 RepID=A0A841J0A7_9SPHN|nr:flagellin [Sphingobium subterraneum]MBB6124124.1 flagellar hook-associated protein 3 FlgL [Sphingobium subterraneum]
MARVATIPLQATMASAIQRSQAALAVTQQQIATGKKAQDYASLGTQSARILSARSMIARQEAHAAVADQVGTTLSIYDASMSTIDSAVSDLRQNMLQAIGTGQTTGLQALIDGAFHQFRVSLNSTERGVALYGGAQTLDTPFQVDTLAGLVGTTDADVFANDAVRASAEVSEGLTVQYGLVASEVGSGLYQAFRTLAEAGTLGTTPTAAQSAKLNEALGQIDNGLAQLRVANADNGRMQGEVETLAKRAEQRSLLWQDIVSKNEDADLSSVAIDLARQKMVLEASYSVFAQLSKLSLVGYL